MASLYERLTGVGLPSEQQDKIAIHSFAAAIEENLRGYLTGAEVVNIYSLDAAQTTQAQSFIALLGAAPDKLRFMRVFKNIAYMAETGDAYLTQAEFVSRLQSEVTDQGGTLP